jgi:hypothetical protein
VRRLREALDLHDARRARHEAGGRLTPARLRRWEEGRARLLAKNAEAQAREGAWSAGLEVALVAGYVLLLAGALVQLWAQLLG